MDNPAPHLEEGMRRMAGRADPPSYCLPRVQHLDHTAMTHPLQRYRSSRKPEARRLSEDEGDEHLGALTVIFISFAESKKVLSFFEARGGCQEHKHQGKKQAGRE